jgi:cell division topological specificity factor
MSENILKELCNRLINLFKQTETKEESAKDVACNRLRVVLMQDRTNLTPELLQRMRKELIELLSKYVEMDKDALELNFDQEGDQMALMLSIPVIRAKDEEEIEKALSEESSESDSEDEETEEELDDEEDDNDEDLDDLDDEEDEFDEDLEEENEDDEISDSDDEIEEDSKKEVEE